MHKYLVLMIILGLSFTAEPLSCDEAIRRALEKSPQIKNSEAQLDAAYWEHWSGTSALLPTISAGYTNIWNETEIAFPIDEETTAVIQPKEQWQKTVDVTWPLFTGGALFSSQRIAANSHRLAKLTHTENVEQIKLKTLETYFNLVKVQGVLDITYSARDLIQENIRMIQSMHDLGMVEKKDLLRAEVSVAEINQQIQQAEQGVRMSAISLNMMMGEELDLDVTPISEVPEVQLTMTLDDLESYALENRSSYQTAVTGNRLAKWAVRASGGSLLPSVAAIYHWQEDSEASLFSGGQDSWRAMLNVSFELPVGLSNVARLGEARAVARQAKYMLQQAGDGVQMEVEANYLQYQLMEESLVLAQEQQSAAEENYAAYEASYRNGESSQIELIDARNSLTNARINVMNTRIDLFISYNRLMYSCGYPIGKS